MSILAGEMGRKAVDEAARNVAGVVATRGGGFDMPGERQGFGPRKMGRGEIDRPGYWFDGDMPGEQQSVDAKDMGRGEAGRPGSGFDGPWDKQEARTGGGEKLGSSFEGDWDKRAEYEQSHIKT